MINWTHLPGSLSDFHGCVMPGVMFRSDFTYYADIWDCLFHFFFSSLHQSPCTIRIWSESYVQYNLVANFCMIQSRGWLLYNINLRATITTILGIRGVTIPITLVSSATDSIRWHVVLFKPVPILTSDPKSEFLCQSSHCCTVPPDSPESTSYAWDISHALDITYHPYCHSPSALTEYLKQKLHHQRAKRLGHSLPAQAEQNVPLECNINSDFTLATTTLEYLDWRGEQNVPKRYLKEADWCKDGPLGTGYYVADPDNPADQSQSTSISRIYSGGVPIPKKTSLYSKDQHPSDMDYVSTMKKEPRTEAAGDR